jgi:adenylate cyclase
MPDVFISYKSTERALVGPIARALEAAGYSIWWDPQLEVSSHPYPRQISEAMESAKAVIVCWSPASLASDWVIAEASAAREVGKLIQLKVASCVLPPPFNVLEAADLSSPD